jgi:hypothetical protein
MGKNEFNTVGELIDQLIDLGRERILIVDDDGDTYGLPASAIGLWDDNNNDSPVAIFLNPIIK